MSGFNQQNYDEEEYHRMTGGGMTHQTYGDHEEEVEEEIDEDEKRESLY